MTIFVKFTYSDGIKASLRIRGKKARVEISSLDGDKGLLKVFGASLHNVTCKWSGNVGKSYMPSNPRQFFLDYNRGIMVLDPGVRYKGLPSSKYGCNVMCTLVTRGVSITRVVVEKRDSGGIKFRQYPPLVKRT